MSTDDPTTTQPPQAAMVPKSRLDEEILKRRTAEERIGTLEGEIATLKRDGKDNAAKAGSHDALVARVQELEAQGKAKDKRHAEDLDLIRKGFTDVELFRFEHGRATDAPKTAAEYAQALLDGKREEAPAWAQSFIPEGDDDADGDAGAGATKEPKTPKSRNASVTEPRPGSTGALSQDQLREVWQECERTGDWSAWREARGMATT